MLKEAHRRHLIQLGIRADFLEVALLAEGWDKS